MNIHQQTALAHHCRFAFETAQPCFAYVVQGGRYSIVLTVQRLIAAIAVLSLAARQAAYEELNLDVMAGRKDFL